MDACREKDLWLRFGIHPMKLIDSHAHLEMADFAGDLEEVVRRATDSGIEHIFTVGTEERDWRKAIEIAQTHCSVYAVLGVHPHHAKEIDDRTYPLLRGLCRSEKVKAYGEIGLDFYRNRSPRELQLRRFREQVELAKELDLPIVVHDREAHQETLEILESGEAGKCGGILHCFSGDYEMAMRCIEMGFYLSIPGTVTFQNAGRFQELVKRLPLEYLLVETDAPFLTPVPFRGKRNEPSYVRHTAQKLAEIKNVSLDTVSEITTRNARRIYRLD